MDVHISGVSARRGSTVDMAQSDQIVSVIDNAKVFHINYYHELHRSYAKSQQPKEIILFLYTENLAHVCLAYLYNQHTTVNTVL